MRNLAWWLVILGVAIIAVQGFDWALGIGKEKDLVSAVAVGQ